jgi:septal ring factor EnvC (AmiA/AmiB activator)
VRPETQDPRPKSDLSVLKLRSWVLGLGSCVCLLAIPGASSAQGQDKIRQRRAELEAIRLERTNLEGQMRELTSTMHDLSAEVANLDKRADATARLLRALDRQLGAIGGELNEASLNVRRAEIELAGKRGVLRQRLVDIYKRGPTFSAQAMLSATSFGELVARYKYLHLLALRDRALVHRVDQLRGQIVSERDRLVSLQRNLQESREDRRVEEAKLRALEQQQRQQLARTKLRAQVTSNKLSRIRISEAQVATAINDLEAERRRAEAARPATAPRVGSSIRTAEYGRLEWPVTGELIYTFGREVQANNTSIRWNGIGIRSEVGTAVRAVSAGKVATVQQYGTYGLTVIVDHGGGDYTIYASLARADVRLGETISRGQNVGVVGVSDPDMPAHLHFEIRHGKETINPVTWLRRR